MKALCLVALVALAGCTQSGEGQVEKRDGDEPFVVTASCPITIHGDGGLDMEMGECGFETAPGEAQGISIACTGASGNLGTLARNRAGGLQFAVYAPGGGESSQAYKVSVENNQAATATCSLTAPGAEGKYVARMTGSCYTESLGWTGWRHQAKECVGSDSFKVQEGWL